jgi:small subunit ribosomal protein S20
VSFASDDGVDGGHSTVYKPPPTTVVGTTRPLTRIYAAKTEGLPSRSPSDGSNRKHRPGRRRIENMANTSSAKKATRKIAARTEVNKARRSRMRTFVRKLEEAIAAGDVATATASFVETQSEMMRAAGKGIIHKNTAARKVSRLAARIKKLTA